MNGGGLGNWSAIFFEDIVPNYQFDALVIATYGDDLARQYSYLHAYDGPDCLHLGYFLTLRIRCIEDFFANYLPRMAHHKVSVATDVGDADCRDDCLLAQALALAEA